MLNLVCAMQRTEKCCARLKCNKYHFAWLCVYAFVVPTVRLYECMCVCAIVFRKNKL